MGPKVSDILAKAKARATAAAALGRGASGTQVVSSTESFVPGRDNNDADDFDRRLLNTWDSQSMCVTVNPRQPTDIFCPSFEERG